MRAEGVEASVMAARSAIAVAVALAWSLLEVAEGADAAPQPARARARVALMRVKRGREVLCMPTSLN